MCFYQLCQSSPQLEKECGAYAHQVVKPMFAYFDLINRNIERNIVDMEKKNEQVNRLGKEVASCSSKDNIIRLLEEKDETNRVLISSLQQQVDLLARANKKLEINLTEKESKEIIEIKEKFETALKVQGETISETNKKIIQLETEVENSKKQINTLTNTVESKNIELEQLKAKVNNIKVEKKNSKSCKDIALSGVHSITPSSDITFEVLCSSMDSAGSGWTVIQQRINGGVEFQRDWKTYRNGFGDFFDGDFFLGLEKIHRLTTEQPHELYIHMQKFDGYSYYARYDEFVISGEDEQYKLSKLTGFSGSRDDELNYSLNAKFSTYDRDNDNHVSLNCANHHNGGWWYKSCTRW